MRKNIILGFLIASTVLFAQKGAHQPIHALQSLFDKATGTENSSKEINSLMDLDLHILTTMPCVGDYKHIKEKIQVLPNEFLNDLDSIEYKWISPTRVNVRIFTQNYAYQSANSYLIVKQAKENSDSLNLVHIKYDMKMKSIIEDYFEHKDRKLNFEIIAKPGKHANMANKIIVRKTP